MNFGRHLFVNYIEYVEWMAEQIRDAGVAPELDVFTLGHVEIAKQLIKNGRVNTPPLFQLCMGIHATAFNMMTMLQALPENAIWAEFGIAATSFPIIAQSAILGGNNRVGIVDNLYLGKGVMPRTNRELVGKIVKIINLLEKEAATPDETRGILHL